MKLLNNQTKLIEQHTSRTSKELLILFIEIITILVVFIIAKYISKQPNTDISAAEKYKLKQYYFLAAVLGILIIHNLVIGGWHSPKDLIFIGILVVIGIWVFDGTVNTDKFDDLPSSTIPEPAVKQQSRKKERATSNILQPLGINDINYNLPEPGRNNKSQTAQIVGSDINDAHPMINTDELVWGNRPEHYDFVPDDVPGYLELESIRKLKRLQKKVKRDKNYKYLAQIKPYDAQSMHRPDSEPNTGLLLHQSHGLDDLFLANADKHKAYELPKEVLDALSNSPYGVWKEGARCSANVKSRGKYQRNNGVPGSWYKFLNEPEPTLISGGGIKCSIPATTTTRPNGLHTSPELGTGPVMQHDTIQDDMITANSKFRTAEYFTNRCDLPNANTVNTGIQAKCLRTDITPILRPPRVGLEFSVGGTKPLIPLDANTYSLYSDAINQRLPGSSDKISQYATNYPLVSKQSLECINNNQVELFAK